MSETPNTTPPIKFHWSVLVIVIVITFVFTFYILDRKHEKERKAFEDTVSAEMKKLGDSLQARGSAVSYEDIEKKVRDTLGKEVLDEIKKTHGSIESLSTAVAVVKGQIEDLKPPIVPGVRKEDGSFKVALEQNRPNLPALTMIDLSYDASKPGLTGLTGKWFNYTEVFSTSFGQWRTFNDGVRSAVTLKRDVYKDPDRKEKVGTTENIEVSNADFFFTTDMIRKYAPPPKYTVFFGGAVDSKTGKTNLSFYLEKKFTSEWGITSGYVNRGYLLGTSYTFGHQ
jgi:hypothetical protein